MKRIAIVVIAADNQPVYLHYIRSYWTEMIRHTTRDTPHIDVFLLLENGSSMDPYLAVADNVIEDPIGDFDEILEPRFQTLTMPGILHKTIYAFEQLHNDYDVFFRTNLSSMIKLPALDAFVQSNDDLCYSGNWIWRDALRADLLHWNRIGPDRSIKDLAELDEYPGNTFVSGSGFLLSAVEAKTLVEQKHRLRWDIPDDVAVGLMFDRCDYLPGTALVVEPDLRVEQMIDNIRSTAAFHIRLQHFPVERAAALWQVLEQEPLWK